MAERIRSRWLAGTAVVLTGNGLSAGLGFLLLVLLGRTLAPAELGIVSPIVSLLDVSQIAIETVFGAGTIRVAARYLESDPRRADMALKLSFWMRLGAAGGFVVLALALAPLLSELLFGSRAWVGELRLALLAIVGVAVHTSLMSVLQVRQRFRRLAVVTLYKNGTRVLLFGGLIAAGAVTVSATVGIYAAAALASAGLALLSVSARFTLRPGVDRGVLKELVDVNKWMFVVMFAHFGGRIDIFMLSSLSTPEQVGQYTVAFQLCVAVAVLGQSLVTTLLPRVSALDDPGQMQTYLRTCLRLVPLALVPLAAAFALSGWLIPWLLGESYADAAPVFNIVLTSSLITLVANMPLMLLFPLGRVDVIAIGTLTQVVLRVALNLVLIPRHGALGAALADVTGRVLPTLVMIGTTWWLLRRFARATPAAGERPDAP
jgi:O-antigen/teichoic acid export membrane protein